MLSRANRMSVHYSWVCELPESHANLHTLHGGLWDAVVATQLVAINHIVPVTVAVATIHTDGTASRCGERPHR